MIQKIDSFFPGGFVIGFSGGKPFSVNLFSYIGVVAIFSRLAFVGSPSPKVHAIDLGQGQAEAIVPGMVGGS